MRSVPGSYFTFSYTTIYSFSVEINTKHFYFDTFNCLAGLHSSFFAAAGNSVLTQYWTDKAFLPR